LVRDSLCSKTCPGLIRDLMPIEFGSVGEIDKFVDIVRREVAPKDV
jgi:hypothetical protein